MLLFMIHKKPKTQSCAKKDIRQYMSQRERVKMFDTILILLFADALQHIFCRGHNIFKSEDL